VIRGRSSELEKVRRFSLISSMLSNPKSLLIAAPVLVVLWTANGSIAKAQAAHPNSRRQEPKGDSPRGKQTFASTCASCHGLDGKGSERAPNIAETPKVQRMSDSQIFRIIENGIPGTGMPPFHALESSQIKAVVAYLRALQGKTQAVKLPGDPERGKTIFFGKAGCSGCHMIARQGGFIASDLSGYARTHSADQIRSAITEPTPGGDRQVRLVTATTRGGEKYAGRVRNEDNFSLQLEGLDGAFYFLSKSDLASLEYDPRALMPSDYGSALGPSELDDVVAYLISVANANSQEAPKKLDEEE
jgi:cytochrome c oxidase cbb3-type subunit III